MNKCDSCGNELKPHTMSKFQGLIKCLWCENIMVEDCVLETQCLDYEAPLRLANESDT